MPYERLEEHLFPFIATLPLGRGAQSDKAVEEVRLRVAERAELQRRIDTLLDQIEEGGTAMVGRLRQREQELAKLDTEISRLRNAQAGGSTMPSPVDSQAEVERLRGEMEIVQGEKRYALRARINAALAKVCESATLTRDGYVDLSIEPSAVLRPSKAETKARAATMMDATVGRLRWSVTNITPDVRAAWAAAKGEAA